MDVRMMLQGLTPGVKYHGHAELGAEMLGIGRDGGECLGRRAEQLHSWGGRPRRLGCGVFRSCYARLSALRHVTRHTGPAIDPRAGLDRRMQAQILAAAS